MKTILALTFTMFVAGCSRPDEAAVTVGAVEYAIPAVPSAGRQEQSQSVMRVSAPTAMPLPADLPKQDAGSIRIPDRMLIRNGGMTIRVDTIERALTRLNEVATAVGAILSGSSIQSGEQGHRAATAELRVRAEQFDRTINALHRLGLVEVENVSTEDVGEEFVDVTARIANGRRLEARLLNLVATRTAKLADVVAVEHELANVRGEIESLEGRRRYLESHANLSTLTVSLHEPVTVVGIAGPGVMQQAFERSWDNFVWLVALVIQSAGVVVPLALVAVALWTVSRRRNSPAAVR